MIRYNIKQILENDKLIGKKILVNGWIATQQVHKNVLFININDGSSIKNIQIVSDLKNDDIENNIILNLTRGSSISVIGILNPSPGSNQNVELKINSLNDINILGTSNINEYPMSKSRHSLEYLRNYLHLKSRTNMGALVARIRNTCSMATHNFFQKKECIYIHTPVLTANDCEGAGETFSVINKNKKNFFSKDVYLTVSGQLQLESYALGMKNVYAFGPTFRAENSNTSRHLSEFWMVEPEFSFIDFNFLLNNAEEYIKFCIQSVLDLNKDDIQFINKYISKGHIKYLEKIVNNKFKRLSYTEAISYLQKAYNNKKYKYLVKWGIDLSSHQEKFLTSKLGPLIIYNYPNDIKSFYMERNIDNTVKAMDILLPNIGEIIGGSMRETNYNKLINNMKNKSIPNNNLEWYLDLRKYGTVAHGGYGVGFERLIMLLTGLTNIKDCILFPRYSKTCLL